MNEVWLLGGRKTLFFFCLYGLMTWMFFKKFALEILTKKGFHFDQLRHWPKSDVNRSLVKLAISLKSNLFFTVSIVAATRLKPTTTYFLSEQSTVFNDWAVLWVLICMLHLTVCYYHVTYVFQSESTLYSCLNV